MGLIVTIFAAFILLLIILSKIPGLEHLVKPIIDLVFTSLKWGVEHSVAWSIWFFKKIMSAHSEVLRHLIYSAEDIDPTLEMKNKTS